MSDTPLSVIDFLNKMVWVWTILYGPWKRRKILFSSSYQVSNLCELYLDYANIQRQMKSVSYNIELLARSKRRDVCVTPLNFFSYRFQEQYTQSFRLYRIFKNVKWGTSFRLPSSLYCPTWNGHREGSYILKIVPSKEWINWTIFSCLSDLWSFISFAILTFWCCFTRRVFGTILPA